MRKSNVKKGLAVGIFFLLMLVSIPIINGEWIEYPKEEGPYNVLISGTCLGMAGSFYTLLIHFLPLWLLFYPLHIEWDFEENTTFYVNGEKQDIVYPAQIRLSGFKGYGTSIHMLMLKIKVAILMDSFPGFLPIPRARVIGQCAEIIVHDAK